MTWELWLVLAWFFTFMVTFVGSFSLIGSRHFVPLGFKKELVRTSALLTFVTAILVLMLIEIYAGLVKTWNVLHELIWASTGSVTLNDLIRAGNMRGVIISLLMSIVIALIALIIVARMDRRVSTA